MTRTGYDAVTATYADADIVARPATCPTPSSRRCAPCRTSRPPTSLAPIGIEVRKGGTSRWQLMLPTTDDPRLSSLVVEDGAAPDRAAVRSRCRPRRRRPSG